MDCSEDLDDRLWTVFHKEYTSKPNPFTHVKHWTVFINQKDLGVLCSSSVKDHTIVFNYKIIDKKKFLLSQLKYGY